MIVAFACHFKGPAINTYTVRVHEPELDELDGQVFRPGTSEPSRLSFRIFATKTRSPPIPS